jgi:hypothetical protein
MPPWQSPRIFWPAFITIAFFGYFIFLLSPPDTWTVLKGLFILHK